MVITIFSAELLKKTFSKTSAVKSVSCLCETSFLAVYDTIYTFILT